MKIVIPEIDNDVVKQAASTFSGITFVRAESLDIAAEKVATGKADTMVAGIDQTTRDVVLTCKRYLPLKSRFFSSCFICKKGKTTFALADGGVNKDPNPEQFYVIVRDTAEAYQKYTGETPKIAILSYSTKGSGGKLADAEKNEYVINRLRKEHPEYIIDGEMQLDAAMNRAVAKKKMPDSPIQGDANVLIVPDLNSGNILYKALEQLAGFTVAGPIIQGFEMPLADFSRGSTAEDVKLTIEVIKTLLSKNMV